MTTSNLNEPGVPNKPLVLTATDFTEEHSRNLGRQHTGRPLGSQQRAAKRRAAGSERRPEEHELGQRATFNEQRSGERRVPGGAHRAAGDEPPATVGGALRAMSSAGGERRTVGHEACKPR